MMPEAYKNLKKRFAWIANLGNAASILARDAETVMAPGSMPDRTEQHKTLAAVIHMLISAPETAQWLDEAEAAQDALSPEDRRNLTLMRRYWIHVASLPADLAEEEARLRSEGEALHTRYYKAGDWDRMADWYAHSFKTMRAIGAAKQERLGLPSAYEALLDQFSPDIKVDLIEREFARLKQALPGMIAEALERQKEQSEPLPLQGPFPAAQQEKLCLRLAEMVGFDFNRGRFDMIGGHPSSGGSSDDSRITTRCDESDFLKAATAALHEAGHSLYEQNQPAAWRYQPAGGHLGMAVHESQSMIIELQACQIPEFFPVLEKLAREIFNQPDDPALAAGNLERLVNRVQPSLIRVYADEMTYPCHVIMRFALERMLIEGRAEPSDIPRLWSEGLEALLGVRPPDAAQGWMQDVHWPSGRIGYFPAYTLGAMMAAQLFAAACRARPEIRAEIGRGNFRPLKEWLAANVHSKGALLTAEEMLRQATGEDLNAHYYLDHLSRRYLGRPWESDTAIRKEA